MNIGHEFRGKCDRVDRAPAGMVDRARDGRDAAGLLRRDDVCDLRIVVAEIGDERVGRGLDRDDPAALRQRYPLDHPGIQFLPGILEQALLRKGVLGVENEHLGARLLRFQVMGDQAGAFIRRGRTSRGGRGHRKRNQAAVVHGLELPAQQQGLLARLPGMGHFRSGCLVIAGQRVEPQVDAGREHQAVVAERRAVGETDHPRLRIDLDGRLRNDGHAIGGDPVIAELLRFDVAQARDHLVAERAGGEGPVRLDQRHLQFAVDLVASARAQAAPPKPPPITTMRAADCAWDGHGKANDAAVVAMPRTTFLRVIRRSASMSMIRKMVRRPSRPPL